MLVIINQQSKSGSDLRINPQAQSPKGQKGIHKMKRFLKAIPTVIIIIFVLWFIISFLNVNMNNKGNSNIAEWNIFKIFYDIMANM